MKYLFLFLAVSVSGANLIPNSSFESGTENWITQGSFSGPQYGWDESPSGRLSLTNTVHGLYSLNWRTRLWTQPMYLAAGPYTLSASMKASSPATTVSYGLVAHDYQTVPSSSFSVGTTMQRYSDNTLTVVSNGYYSVFFVRTDPGAMTWIDSVQLEAGSSLSIYAPLFLIEAGLTTTNHNHVLNKETQNKVQLKIWNDGALTNNFTNTVKFYDFVNTNFYTIDVVTNALPAGATVININVPTGKSGWIRAQGWQPRVNKSDSELAFFIRPYTVTKTQNTNGVIGTHPNSGLYSVPSAKEAGYEWARDLSPSGVLRWSTMQPNGTGPFLWDSVFSQYWSSFLATNGMVPHGVLTPGLDGYWPPGAVNGDGSASLTAWSNYVWHAVSFTIGAPTNYFVFETGNEMHNITSPTDMGGDVIGTFLASSNNARFQAMAARVVKDVCPTCTTIGMAGENQVPRALQIWGWWTPTERTWFDMLSCHLYPIGQGVENPNSAEDDTSAGRSSLLWAQAFAGLKPLINSEMGNQGNKGGMLGALAMSTPVYQIYGSLTPEPGRDWGMAQRYISVEREARTVIRNLGMGFKRIITYRQEDVDADFWVANYIDHATEHSGTPRKGAAAALIAANYFFRVAGGLGRLTNVSLLPDLKIEAYYATNTLGTIVGIWCSDQAERTINLTSNQFAFYDVMGNLLSTNQGSIRIGRSPRFIVSGGMTTAILKTNVELANVSGVSDTCPPNVSIDVTPIGQITAGTNVFKWTVIDGNKQVWSLGSYGNDYTNNRSRIKFYADQENWIDCGVSNHFIGYFGPERRYQLIVEAKDFYNNTSVTYGPFFGDIASPSEEVPPTPPPTPSTPRKLRTVRLRAK